MFSYWCPSSNYFNATVKNPIKYFEHSQPEFLYVLLIALKSKNHNICCVYRYLLLLLLEARGSKGLMKRVLPGSL